MRKLLSFLLIFNLAHATAPTGYKNETATTKTYAQDLVFPNNQLTKQAGLDSRIETGNTNLLTNPSFEHSTVTTGWTITNATATADTTNQVEGKKALSLALTGALSVVQDSTINAANLVGLQGVARVKIKTSDVDGLKVCARNAGVTSTSLCINIPKDGVWKEINIPNILTATSNGIAITSTGTTGTVKLDDAFVGTSAPFQGVNGAKLVGTATWAAVTSCAWSTTSATFVDPSANASCNNPTVTGGITAPGTKVPKVVITDAQPGSYYFVATGSFYKASGVQGQIRFSDGTLHTNAVTNSVSGAASFAQIVAGTIVRTTQASNWTVGIQLASNGITSQIENDTPSLYEDFQIAVYYFPPESKIYSQASQDYAYTNAGTITIGATTTAPTKGTIVTDRIMASRKGQNLIAEYQYEQSSAGTAGSGDYLFTLPSGLSFDSSVVFFSTGTAVSTATAKSVVGYGKITQGTTTSYNVQLIAYDSTRFRVATTENGTTNAGIFHNSANYNFANNPLAFDFKLDAPIKGWQDYGVIVGSFVDTITTPSSVKRVIHGVDFYTTSPGTACTGTCSLSNYYGASGWITSIVRTGLGDYTLTLNSSYWLDVTKVRCQIKHSDLMFQPKFTIPNSSGVVTINARTNTGSYGGTDIYGTLECTGSIP